jgi:hypothetical protein
MADRFGGQVFKDVDSLEPGDDWVEVITRVVGSCDVLLALIGDRWLTITDEDGRRRLDDPDDFVRLEIEAALARDVRVIPILVEGARMPRATELPPSLAKLARRQALVLSPANFDTSRLLRVLDKTLAEVRTEQIGAVTISAPPGNASDRDTTEMSKTPEQAASSPLPSVAPAGPVTGPEVPRDSQSVPEPSSHLAEAGSTPDEDQPGGPDPETSERSEPPERLEPAESSPMSSVSLATPATDPEGLRDIPSKPEPKPDMGEIGPPLDGGEASQRLRHRLSKRAWITVGACVAMVLVLGVVLIANFGQGPGSVVFEDDFSGSASGWQKWSLSGESTGGYYSHDSYYVSAKKGDVAGGSPVGASSVSPSAPPSINIKVETRVSAGTVQSAQYGILCRSHDAASYAFVVQGDSVSIWRHGTTGDARPLDTGTAQIDDGGNELFATCEGHDDEGFVYLQLLVNGKPVVEATDKSPLPAGTVGLFVDMRQSDTAGKVQFDHFVVSRA